MKKSKVIQRILLCLIAALLIVSVRSAELENPILTDYESTDIYIQVPECQSTIILTNGSLQCTKYKYTDVWYDTKLVYDGIIRIDGKEIKFDNYFCSLHDNLFHCVHINDGYHAGEKAECNEYGGMTCKIIIVYNKHSYSITDTYGEIWSDSKKISYKSI